MLDNFTFFDYDEVITPQKGDKENIMRRRYLPTIFDDFDALCTALPSGCCTEGRCERKSDGLSIAEDPEHLFIDAHLPGVDPKGVDVTIDPHERRLVISGESHLDRENVNWHLKGSSQFRYEVPLSNEIDLDSKVEAVSRNGVLRVTLIKNKGHKPLKVDVKVD